MKTFIARSSRALAVDRPAVGTLAVEERSAGGPPVVFIHGNSFCRGVFRYQLEGRLARSQRLIAFDLPGHGESSEAPKPLGTYTWHARITLPEGASLRERKGGTQ